MNKGNIILNVARLLNDREVKHHETWLKKRGFSRREARTLLQQRPGRLNLEQVQRLCELFKCMPQDLLDIEGDPKNHLNKLRKPKHKKLADLLDGRSQEDIDRLWRGLEGGDGPEE